MCGFSIAALSVARASPHDARVMQGERPRGGWAATTRALADSTSPWLGPIGREGVRCPRPALHRPKELHIHIHAALNVGATRQEVAEVIFQQCTYGGMPVVVDALEVYGKVLAERGEPFPGEEST